MKKQKNPCVLSSQSIYKGWVHLHVDTLEIAKTGAIYDHAVVALGNGAAVLPFINKNTILLAKQYRYPVKQILLELIQGGMKAGETPIESAKRELLEETGFVGQLSYMTTIYPLPAVLTTGVAIFRATQLKKIQKPKREKLESLQLVRRSYKQVLREVLRSEHRDSILVIAMLYHSLYHR